MAKLRFHYGTMGSSKTLRLLTTAYNFEEKGIPFIAIKPSVDTRDGENIIKSRVGLERECVMVGSNVNLYELIGDLNHVIEESSGKVEWVLVDECQFLTEKQIDELAMVVDNYNINVMCYGLRTDFTSHLFPASKRLFEIGDEFEEIKSRCDCGKKTSINARFDSNGEIITEGDQVVVGGDDLYKAICRKCFFKLIEDKCFLNK